MEVPILSYYDSIYTVDASNIKRLIANKKIIAFKRVDGWAKIGVDPVRGDGGGDYEGPERRESMQ